MFIPREPMLIVPTQTNIVLYPIFITFSISHNNWIKRPPSEKSVINKGTIIYPARTNVIMPLRDKYALQVEPNS